MEINQNQEINQTAINNQIPENRIDNLTEKIDKIENMLQTIQNVYLSLNQELINQNIKLSNQLYGSNCENFNFTPPPPPPATPIDSESNSPNSNSNNKEEKREKNLFYKEESEFVYISGPGTFDNKATIKSIGGEWKPGKKSWCIPIKNFNENIDKFPNIEKIEN